MNKCIQKVGIIRYNPYQNTGSDLCFALALLDFEDNGVVINGVYSRDNTTTTYEVTNGNGIVSIIKTGTVDNVDTYTITFTNGDTTTFTVTNGKDAYQIAVEEGYKGTRAEWINSLYGQNGLSAYEIYKIYYPEYTKSEEEWINDLINGNLSSKEIHTVVFNSNGGTQVETQYIEHGEKVKKPTNPTKEGYCFDNWYTEDGEKWSFVGYTITEDIVLYAHYNPNTYVVTLDPNGGELETTTVEVVFGEKFTLPKAIIFKYDCIWTLGEEIIDETQEWKYAKDVTLKATWIEQEVIILRNADEFNYIRTNLSCF